MATGTTIGYKRIVRFQTIEAEQIRFTINAAKACPVISTIELFNALEQEIVQSQE